MRRFGPLTVLALLFILAGVGAAYYARLKVMRNTPVNRPARLPDQTLGTAQDWTYTKTQDGKPVFFIQAKQFEEVEGKMHLKDVELHIFHKGGDEYDRVRSASAEFNEKGNELYSDGDVEIVMGVPEDEEPDGHLLTIHTSGVHFNSKSQQAHTDRAASFVFDRGEGKAVGADYDSNSRELNMKSQVELIWRGTDPASKPMKIESENVLYKEREHKVWLQPWAKFSRDTLTMNSGPALVTLQNGVIQTVEAQKSQGADHQPNRNLEFAADMMNMQFDGSGKQVQKIVGYTNARLVATSAAGQTTMTTDRVDLDFDTGGADSVLKTALATGHSIAESKPVAKGNDSPDVRILKSDVIQAKMRPDGQEIESVETPGPGAIEFIPTKPAQPHRWMNGDHIWITYGADNSIETFKSVNVSTRTQKPRAAGAKEDPPQSLTWSKNLLARFQPKTSQIDTLEQWADFRYEEGDRKAKADRAVLNQPKNLIDLTGKARVWDATGSADANHIALNQQSGDFAADGNVNSTRMPDKKKDQSGGGGMLNEDEPLHAKAAKMSSTDNNLKIHYEGNVLLWQGANRLQADVVDIDRDDSILKAHGSVVSQLMDKQDSDDKKNNAKPQKKAGPPVFSIVHAPDLVYNDDDKIANYTGGVQLDRGDTRVKSRELKAFLRDKENDSSLDHAFADGAVEIVTTETDRVRTGKSEHAEYYVDQDKVILNGGKKGGVAEYNEVQNGAPRGSTRGDELIWYSKDDRLVVNGQKGKPAQSSLRRGK
ncbi:MAG TPA: LPS export ABC transporter periplasmic protein LptC [Bryobacteraceae bacterium]|nr:LPS export ABC transporter periplasmic protein LptC [Bryobacteraceae bacterium]